MNTLEFLSHLRGLDVKVWTEGNRLRYRAPEHSFSPEMREELAARKSDILLLLNEMDGKTRSGQSPIIQAPREKPIPLSFSQQRMWFLNQLEPESPFYNSPFAARVSGLLDIPVLEKTFNEIRRRHENLRTTFSLIDSEPVPVIHSASPISIPIIEIKLTNEVEREAEVQQIIKAEARRPFDLSKGPLMRVALLRLGPGEHIVIITMHHIISDGWSMGVLLNEIGALYRAFAAGNPSPLPELPIQYADYAYWQKQSMEGKALEEKLDYWKRQLMGASPVLELPSDRPRPAVQRHRGTIHRFHLPAELVAEIQILNRAHGTTLFMVLAAAFNILLYRYTDRKDIVIGTDVAGRDRIETEGLIGFFANMVALRTDLSGDPSFAELLARVREVTLKAYAHRDLPFDLLVAEFQGDRNLSHSPIVQVLFTLQNVARPRQSEERSDLKMNPITIDSGVSKFDLAIEFMEFEQGLAATVEYNTDLFDNATINRMFDNYRTLLAGAVASPQTRISALQALSDAEREQLLTEWNRTRCEFVHDMRLDELIEAQVARSPQAVAVVFQDQRLTYRELNARANRLARALVERGVGPEVLVALLAERGTDFLIAMLAIFKAGGAYLPLDPHHPAHRLGQALGQSGAALVITSTQFRAQAADATAALTTECPPPVQLLEELLEERRPEENLGRHSLPHQLAYVIFTSGSTGAPKGAMVEHRGMVNHLYVKIRDLELTEEDIVAQTASQCFDISVWQFLAALLVGGTVHIIDDEATVDPARLLEQIERDRVSIFELVPSLLRMLLEVVAARSTMRPALSSLRWLIPTGEALPPQICRQWLSLYPEIPLLNAYGPTECSDDVTHHPIFLAPAHEDWRIPIGRPVANTRLYVLDERGEPTPIGIAGELHIGGVGVGRGYIERSELTAEKFIPHAFSKEAGERLYKTGDLARYLPDGVIEFLGRIDHQVKLHGFRIELGEIEAALEQCPGVRESVLMLREDRPGDQRLVGYVAAEAGQELSRKELWEHLKARLPEYMTPRIIIFLQEMPLNTNGKVDRKLLPAPVEDELKSGAAFAPPRTLIEETLAGIWSRALGLQQVGVHDNFFELGGDSILSIQIVARAHQAGFRLTPRQLFQYQTIAELAAVTTMGPVIQAEQEVVTGPLPLTTVQRWFFEQNLPDPHYFNQAIFLETDQALHPSWLESAIKQLLAHHDALRLRFKLEDTGWTQEIAALDEIAPFSRIDLSNLPESEQEPAIEKAAAELQTSLNLSNGPLLRAAMFEAGDQKPSRLLLICHHLVIDGVSWRILLEDLTTAYMQLGRGETIQLPPKTTSFKYWSQRLTEYAQSDALRQELSYWVIEPETMLRRMPVDYPKGVNVESSMRTITASLSVEETEALLTEVPNTYRTQINDVLLTALTKTLTQWFGTQSVLINLEGHGREEIIENIDLSRTVGWFTTIFPVLLKLGESFDPEKTLKSVKEQLKRIPKHGIGYGLLRYISESEEVARKLENAAQAEVVFNYLGRLDQALHEFTPFRLSQVSSGPARSQRGLRHYLLEIDSGVTANQFQITWSYSENLHRQSTIEGLANTFIDSLRSLIAHCMLPESGGYTPSDFSLAGLDQRSLDRLLGKDRRIEDLYPLSPAQHGMLYESLYAPKSGVYIEQLSCNLHGDLNLPALKQAWQQVVNRHPILRTAFRWNDLEEPLQLVRQRVELPWEEEDWRGLSIKDQETQLEAYLKADRFRGFDLSEAPLMRITTVRSTEDSYHFIWTTHHLLLDGWCLSLVFGEVITYYTAFCQGQNAYFEPRRPYRDYIAWLQQQNLFEAETFWRQSLKGFTAPTLLSASFETSAQFGDERGYDEQQIQLPETTTADLQSLARRHQLTLNTLVRGAWALLLHHYSGADDVIFGATVSGRPPTLLEAESMLGLFINALPVRVQISPADLLLDWLRQIQAVQVEMQQYEYSPLARVQQYSDAPRGAPLFDSLLVFENFPADSLQKQGTGLSVSDIHFIVHNSYPITLVAAPGAKLLLQATFDRQRFDLASVTQILKHLRLILEGFVANFDGCIGDLPITTEEENELLSGNFSLSLVN